ncbi:MAG: ABC transporter substrate-binding protein [Oscillospiraceae bacterium]
MKHLRKCTALLLAVLMVLALAACGQKDDTAAVDKDLTVNVVSLNGTTGFGMAKLMADSKAGNAALNYSFTVETDPSNATAALRQRHGRHRRPADERAAAALYNKTDGAVQVLALNTRGVLYVVTDGTESVTSFADLRGKNVYVPVQNPTFIFQYLCEKNGLTVGTDITIDNTYAQPAELNTALASGEVHIAVLPEPMVTIARAANPDLTVALDLTAEWDKVAPAGSLVQGCVVVRKAFADAHPNEVKAFLTEYQASIEYLTAEPDQAGQMIEEAGIFAKAAVAAKAIPNCNVCFVSGADMQAPLTEFLTALSTVAPQSIGGEVPAESFYCILK